MFFVNEDVNFDSIFEELFVLQFGAEKANFSLLSDTRGHEDRASDNLLAIFGIDSELNAHFNRFFECTERVKPHELNGLERIVLESFFVRSE